MDEHQLDKISAALAVIALDDAVVDSNNADRLKRAKRAAQDHLLDLWVPAVGDDDPTPNVF